MVDIGQGARAIVLNLAEQEAEGQFGVGAAERLKEDRLVEMQLAHGRLVEIAIVHEQPVLAGKAA